MKIKFLLFFFILVFTNIKVYSQCAMCKAVVESNLNSGSNIGRGLNDGILYLMSVPYLAILFFGIFWYYQNKKAHQ